MLKLTTPLCHLLGITHPIIQAPISASPEFVAAASNTGGLGMINDPTLGTSRSEKVTPPAGPAAVSLPFSATSWRVIQVLSWQLSSSSSVRSSWM